MPPEQDGVIDVGIVSPSGGLEMALEEAVANLMTQQLSQTGVIAQNNFVTVQKVVDYDYLENKRMVTLDEAIGAREVGSKQVPAGPTSLGS